MDEWGVVATIITLVGLLTAIITPVVKLMSAITKLTTVVDQQKKDYEELLRKTTEGRHKLWDNLNALKNRVSANEVRILHLEEERKDTHEN